MTLTSSIHSTPDTLETADDSRPEPPATPLAPARVAAIVKAHLPFVWRTLRRRGLSPAEADDAAQQVFLVVHRRIDSIIDGAEKAFLFRTAHLVARDVHRVRRRALDRTDAGADTDEISSDAENPEDLANRTQARAVLDELLSKLSDDRRTVFVLFELEGMELAEIAEVMETPVGTVASRLQRARADFQRERDRYKAKLQLKPGAKVSPGGSK